MSVDFLSKNFPPFQVHHAKKPPRFYPDGFQRNVIDFYFIFSDCRLRKALKLLNVKKDQISIKGDADHMDLAQEAVDYAVDEMDADLDDAEELDF